MGPDNIPEENEYRSADILRIHVEEAASIDNLAGNPGTHAAQQIQVEEEEVLCSRWAHPAPWLGAAAAGALLAMLMAVLYRRRLPQ